MKNDFELIRLVGDQRRVGSSLEKVSRHWLGDRERFLFVSPHDDDVALGGGLLMQLACRDRVELHIMIVVTGEMGYCTLEEKDKIFSIRQEETIKCYGLLGIPPENIFWLHFPGSLTSFQGRFEPRQNERQKTVIEGYGGLQNAFTYHLRRIRPTQVFIPTANDLHPDHKITYTEFMISLFHAQGAIWPELGNPLETVPYINEMAVYCDFPSLPQLRVKAPMEAFDKKLSAIEMFQSQRQLKSLVESIRSHGQTEYFRNVTFLLYNPNKYKYRFTLESHIFDARYQ